MEEVGKVFTYFSKVGVAGIKVTGGNLKVGDKIRIQGHTTSLEQVIDSMQIDREAVQEARAGQSVGIQVQSRVRPNDVVYKLD